MSEAISQTRQRAYDLDRSFDRRTALGNVRRVVVKVGTSTLSSENGRLDRAYIAELMEQVAGLRKAAAKSRSYPAAQLARESEPSTSKSDRVQSVTFRLWRQWANRSSCTFMTMRHRRWESASRRYS